MSEGVSCWRIVNEEQTGREAFAEIRISMAAAFGNRELHFRRHPTRGSEIIRQLLHHVYPGGIVSGSLRF